MNRLALILFIMAVPAFSRLAAQSGSDPLDEFKKIEQMSQSGSGSNTADASKTSPAGQKEPTLITATQEADFDKKLGTAIFIGDVHVKDPQYTLTSDKLTVYFKKDNGGSKTSAVKTPAPTVPIPASKSTVSGTAQQGGGLEKVIAEGNVNVESDRPDANGGPPTHYAGKAARVEYITATGEAILSGWPQVQQGINTIVSTEESTVIHLFRDGKMKISGGHRVNINDPGPGKLPETKPAATNQ